MNRKVKSHLSSLYDSQKRNVGGDVMSVALYYLRMKDIEELKEFPQ